MRQEKKLWQGQLGRRLLRREMASSAIARLHYLRLPLLWKNDHRQPVEFRCFLKGGNLDAAERFGDLRDRIAVAYDEDGAAYVFGAYLLGERSGIAGGILARDVDFGRRKLELVRQRLRRLLRAFVLRRVNHADIAADVDERLRALASGLVEIGIRRIIRRLFSVTYQQHDGWRVLRKGAEFASQE